MCTKNGSKSKMHFVLRLFSLRLKWPSCGGQSTVKLSTWHYTVYDRYACYVDKCRLVNRSRLGVVTDQSVTLTHGLIVHVS